MIQKSKPLFMPLSILIATTVLGTAILLPGTGSLAAGALQQKDAKQVYLDKCSVCHGEDGAGKTAKGKKLKVKDIRLPEVQKMSAADMLNVVLKGKGDDMDGFEKELGADLCKKLVEYMQGLAKK
jgi:mono/diheme cytochrome c family protein